MKQTPLFADLRPRVVVCGGRRYYGRKRICEELTKLNPIAIAHGGATGADEIADAWAHVNQVSCVLYPADWNKYGKGAGFKRNAFMLHDFRPDVVLALPGGNGTANTVKRTKALGVNLIQVPGLPDEDDDRCWTIQLGKVVVAYRAGIDSLPGKQTLRIGRRNAAYQHIPTYMIFQSPLAAAGYLVATEKSDTDPSFAKSLKITMEHDVLTAVQYLSTHTHVVKTQFVQDIAEAEDLKAVKEFWEEQTKDSSILTEHLLTEFEDL